MCSNVRLHSQRALTVKLTIIESMGLSKGQKERLYGKDKTHAPVDSHPTPPAARASRYPSGQLYAEPTKSSSNMYLYVALAVAVLLGAYNYFWLLPQFSNFAGNTVPELMFTFGRDHVAAFANNIGPDYLEQYKPLSSRYSSLEHGYASSSRHTYALRHATCTSSFPCYLPWYTSSAVLCSTQLSPTPTAVL